MFFWLPNTRANCKNSTNEMFYLSCECEVEIVVNLKMKESAIDVVKNIEQTCTTDSVTCLGVLTADNVFGERKFACKLFGERMLIWKYFFWWKFMLGIVAWGFHFYFKHFRRLFYELVFTTFTILLRKIQIFVFFFILILLYIDL